MGGGSPWNVSVPMGREHPQHGACAAACPCGSPGSRASLPQCLNESELVHLNLPAEPSGPPLR